MKDITPCRRPFWNTQPADRFDAYVATQSRSPTLPLVPIRQTRSEVTGPLFGKESVRKDDNDLTTHGGAYRLNIVIQGEALGQAETVFFDL